MNYLTETAPAKINLSLHVGPVKANGRHDLMSLVCFSDANVSDILSAAPASNFSLAVEGPFAAQAGPAKSNLVLKAARAVNKALDGDAPPLAFRLNKRLPCAAGIGGGSADAAAALRLIARAYGGERALKAAEIVAPELGGDVLACLRGMPGMMSGEGDVYEPVLNIPTLPTILVNPGTACPTGPVFDAFDQHGAGPLEHPRLQASRFQDDSFLTYLQTQTVNNLQAPAISLVPDIGETLQLLETLEGAKLVRMSGSGATCFAIFDDMESAERGAERLKRSRPDWWVRETLLGGG
ncbi:MAG: 4-(cytidine 5'-diphospho)-2-C-methyl-D-erythritol kinase [Henriciella sp.]